MANSEAAWNTFRRYRHKGIKITEEPGRIVFRQKNMVARLPLAILLIAGVVFFFYPVVYLFSLPVNEQTMLTVLVPVFGWIIYPLILFPLLFRWFVRRATIIDIQPLMVTVWRGREPFYLPASEIKAVDIRREDSFHIAVWHGSVPIYTLSTEFEADAITLREGLTAAMNVVQEQAAAQAPPKAAAPQAAPLAPRPRVFEE